MNRPHRRAANFFAPVIFMLVGVQLAAVTLNDFRSDPHLDPKRLIKRVANFAYELNAEVQEPEQFLKRERGDCDDFATFASLVLAEKKYQPRLISVRMPGMTHVVCYVTEDLIYLDFNNRIYFRPLEKSGPEVRAIADKVCKSFDCSWTTASEFIYTNRVKIMVQTVARAEQFGVESRAHLRRNQTPVRQLDVSF
jgi:hypothetical protein